jgi:hypothetical protein
VDIEKELFVENKNSFRDENTNNEIESFNNNFLTKIDNNLFDHFLIIGASLEVKFILYIFRFHFIKLSRYSTLFYFFTYIRFN